MMVGKSSPQADVARTVQLLTVDHPQQIIMVTQQTQVKKVLQIEVAFPSRQARIPDT